MTGRVTLAELRARYPGAETFTFGDSRTMCRDLLARVCAGAKTATCGAARDFRPGGAALPVVGRRDIARDRDGAPALVIETASVQRMRFCDVDEAFALAEGETPDLAGWRRDHRAYFDRHGGWSDDMELICERFRLVEGLDPCSAAS